MVQAEIVGLLGDHAAGVTLLDKVVEAAETYHRAHPAERRAKVALERALHNNGLFLDPRLSLRDAVDRSVSLLRRSLAIDEGLLAEEPGNAARQASIARTQYNIANKLIQVGEFTDALAMLKLAEPALARVANDEADTNAALWVVVVQSRLAFALAHAGQPRESLPLLDRAEAALTGLRKKDSGSLHLQFEQAVAVSFRGDALALLARWPQSREASARADQQFRQINEVYPIVGEDKFAWDIAAANLSKADAQTASRSR